jgi:EAL domain-containing protein (putative c-di-GMP-specific phosphodiesterase class I)
LSVVVGRLALWIRQTGLRHLGAEPVRASCVIAPAKDLTKEMATRLAHGVAFGLADVDPSAPPDERYVAALGSAVQVAGVSARIGQGKSPQKTGSDLLSLFFASHAHQVEFQPIVDLKTMSAQWWECLFRPGMGSETITDVVEAAVKAEREVDLDMLAVAVTLARIAEVAPGGDPGRASRYSINVLPASLLTPQFEAGALAERVRGVGLSPGQILIECIECQAIHDVPHMKKQVRALRDMGFGFAVDNAGAGFASLSVVVALEPSIIKFNREIVLGVGDEQAKKTLFEGFVSFSRRIGAQTVAQGIENRKDLLALQDREVDFGQSYLLGRPSSMPLQPR